MDGSKFHDFSPSNQKSGGGAIDLVMHVNSCNEREALAWLNERSGEDGMLKATTHQVHWGCDRTKLTPYLPTHHRQQLLQRLISQDS